MIFNVGTGRKMLIAGAQVPEEPPRKRQRTTRATAGGEQAAMAHEQTAVARETARDRAARKAAAL